MRGFGFDNCFVQSSERGEITPIPLMCRRVVWIERDRFLEMLLGFGPLQMVTISNKGERRVCFSQTLVDRQRLFRRSFSFRIRVVCGSHVVNVQQQITIGESGVSETVILVSHDRLAEKVDAFLQSFNRSLVPVVTALKIETIRFGIRRIVSRQLRVVHVIRARTQSLRNVTRDLLRQGNDFRNFATVTFSPDVTVVAHVDQLHAHRQIVARLH